jgi:hypothetical protein
VGNLVMIGDYCTQMAESEAYRNAPFNFQTDNMYMPRKREGYKTHIERLHCGSHLLFI